ncbi:MAG TPA: hypothetical protein VGI60_01100 [Chthoniobacterales bacterium]|jgi:phage tail protein X
MASAKTYTATFAIGAKMLGSFKGVMAQAQARLHRLNTAALAIGRSVLKLGSIFGGLSALGVGAVFSKMFEGTNEAAEALETRTRRLTEALMTHNKIRSLGRAIAEQQVQKIYKANEALAQQGVISKGALDSAASMLALQKLSPKRIVQTLGPLSDMLVATKGVAEAQQMLPEAAFAFGKAVRTGMTRPLQQFGITLSKPEQRLLQQKAKVGDLEGAYKFLMARVKLYAGSSARALKTPEGRIQALDNALAGMRTRMGEASQESRAKMADAWRGLLPEIEPILTKLRQLGFEAMEKLAHWVQETALPAFHRFKVFLNGPLGDALGRLKKSASNLGSEIGSAFGKMFESLTGGQNKKPQFYSFYGHLIPKKRDLASAIGDDVLKAIKKLGDAFDWLANHRKILEPAIRGITAALVAYTFAAGLASMVNPFSAIALAVGGAIFGVTWLNEHLGELQKRQDVWGSIARGFKTVDDAVNPVVKSIKEWVAWLWNLAAPVREFVYEWETGLIDKVLHPIQAIKEAWDGVVKAFEKIPNWFGGTKPPAMAPPQAAPIGMSMPKGMATGGIIRGHSLLQVAERNKPEAIIPLTRTPRSEGLLNYASRAMGMGSVTNNRGDIHVKLEAPITINGNVGDSELRAIEARLDKLPKQFADLFKRAQEQGRRVSFESGYS